MIMTEIPLGQAFAVLPVYTPEQFPVPALSEVVGPDLPEPPPPPK